MSQYLDKRQAQQSYRPKGGLMSPGLQRAREPFRFRNALTGLGLGLFAFGIYSYSISAVKQDVFDDIDEEAKALARTGTISGTTSLPSTDPSPTPVSAITPKPPPVVLSKDEEKKIMENAVEAATGIGGTTDAPRKDEDASASAPVSPPRQARGILQNLDTKLPWLLDPTTKTLVRGAPPIDGQTPSKRS
ncbi:hypothetical protein P691DRAFT_758440 [Macrolepiota fuliginosa MF-IS2]|uniref:Cytochrome c oxidase assembly factor 3 n=1 Tax=Macrolepiota fuliginosa MF-IS2 TaxID=1400762 RepID=A0A9P6C5V0_9AGAR|nr:hypothetical protein P691DRAFT_758440 [Macrolepiota fuliginosa MF-IS2]